MGSLSPSQSPPDANNNASFSTLLVGQDPKVGNELPVGYAKDPPSRTVISVVTDSIPNLRPGFRGVFVRVLLHDDDLRSLRTAQ